MTTQQRQFTRTGPTAAAKLTAAIGCLLLAGGQHAQAGMTVYGLNEVYRLRAQELSFFLLLLVFCTVVFRVLWNTVRIRRPSRTG